MVGGAQEGVWTYYWPNGNPKARGEFVGDTREGPWTWWYENGNKRIEGSFTSEHKDGLWRHWYSDGTPWMSGWFDKGRKTGEWSTYVKSGELAQRGAYVAGDRTSLWIFYAEGGRERARGWYFGDEPVGPWEMIDAEGTRTPASYALPEDHALFLECWEDGSPRRGGFIREDRPAGRWLSWHENGEPRLAANFSVEGLTGTWRAYDPDGEPLGFGRVVGGRPGEAWNVFRDSQWVREGIDERTRTPAMWSGEWSRAAEIEAGEELIAIEAWMDEMTSPRDSTELFLRDLERGTPSLDLEQLSLDEALAPAPPEQILTRREVRGIPRWLEAYTEDGVDADLDFYSSGEADPEPGDRREARRLEGQSLVRQEFLAVDGSTVELGSVHEEGWTLVVLLRGFAGLVCPYCPVQLKALAPFEASFSQLGVSIVAVYPGSRSGVDQFLAAYRETFDGSEPPYKILYDVDSRLAQELELLDRELDSPILARPTTLLLDELGTVRYAYVGEHRGDRPAAAALLEAARELTRR